MTSRSQSVEEQIDAFLARYDPRIAAIGRAARVKMRRALPGWSELVYDNYSALGFGFSPTARPSDALFSIVLYPRWVRLFFLQNGADLPDPDGRLSGSGRRVRSVILPSARELDTPAVRTLMAHAKRLAEIAVVPPGPVSVTVRSVSRKQRPRRPQRPDSSRVRKA